MRLGITMRKNKETQKTKDENSSKFSFKGE